MVQSMLVADCKLISIGSKSKEAMRNTRVGFGYSE